MDKTINDYKNSIVSFYEEIILYLKEKKKFKLVKKLPNINFAKFNANIRANNESKIRFSEFISLFDYVIRNNFPEELLHNYYDNMDDFGIYCTCFQLGDYTKKDEYAGRYNTLENIICINIKDENQVKSIYHELFHLASTNRMQIDRIATGFSSYQYGQTIGSKLNEGYTDLMALRYFGSVGFVPAYITVLPYVNVLEQVVGKNKMEALYLTANPGELVRELSKYDSVENIMYFINNLDYVNDLKESYIDNEQRLRNTSIMLVQWYVRKLILNGENLTDSFVKNKIRAFAWQLPAAVENPKKLKEVYYIDINQIIEDVIEEELKNNKRR